MCSVDMTVVIKGSKCVWAPWTLTQSSSDPAEGSVGVFSALPAAEKL